MTLEGGFDAALFDLDGVLTTTRRLHIASWKRTFDEFLEQWDAQHGASTPRFYEPDDYPRHLDGKPRQDGVQDFLRSRGIELPPGDPSSPPDEISVWGIGNRKQELVDAELAAHGVEAFPGSVAWVRELREKGVKTGVVSSSRNTSQVLEYAGIGSLFDVQIDGETAEELGLAGKPAPDTFLEAARRLGVAPDRVVVVEDALAGVEAGRAGGFGLVIGVDRADHADELRAGGADIVVRDLAELTRPDQSHLAGPREHRLAAAAFRLLQADREYPIEQFRLVERRYKPDFLPQTESLFAVSNGYLGIRGSFEEGTPASHPATLLNGFYETWPILYPEEAYGFAHTGQTILNLPDGTIVRLYVDGEPLACDRTEILQFERALDMRQGALDRTVVWQLGDGRRFRVRSRRFVSLEHRHLAALRYEITALDAPASLTLVSELVRPDHEVDRTEDPRRGRGAREGALRPVGNTSRGTRVTLSYGVDSSGLHLSCGMEHDIQGPADVDVESSSHDHLGRVVFRFTAPKDQPATLYKYLAYHHGRDPFEELSFRVDQTLDLAARSGWKGIFSEHRQKVDAFWSRSDVVVESAPLFQQAIRFNLFTLLQATARVEGYGVPAKGLSGEGYEGHYFWDAEIYVLPFLAHTSPRIARNLLLHRYGMLDTARRRAAELGHAGALFPWRTIGGEEASAYYAAGTAQYHINADIAYAIDQYVRVTGDEEFLFRYGSEMLVETARMWVDLGFFSQRRGGRFVINGVTGPDEYSTVVDNNTYTNLMARENLRLASRTVRHLRNDHPADFRRLVERVQLGESEVDDWERAAELMYVSYDKTAGVHLQDDRFLELELWDFQGTPADHYPLLLHYHPLVIYRHQVIKQADVVLATVLLGEEFSLEEKRRIFEYYDPLTAGDSSLSESIQSIAAAEVGALRAAEEYLVDAATVDLADNDGNVRDGLHVASAGGVWMALVYGFGGMRNRGDLVSFRPRLPARIRRLRFPLRLRGAVLEVDIGAEEVSYRLRSGGPLQILHDDTVVELKEGAPVTIAGAYREEGQLPFLWIG
jgi:alpha,alpha-trehalose phosphorylase